MEKDIYIVLTNTGTLFTRFIRLFTRQPLNHASISFTKELCSTYSFGRKRANNPFIGGFVKEDTAGKLFRRADCAIYKVPVSMQQYKNMREFVQKIERDQCYYKYNLVGLVGVLFNRTIDTKNAYFCSQFVAAVLTSGGIAVTNKPESLVKPSDFMGYEGSQLIHQGKLSDFVNQQEKDSTKWLLQEKKRYKWMPENSA
ncbi:hypothetical protein [Ornithinibacillus contaminans]|uniref:hypothetical protein n=1 Tax=Ornithinibacillus contaminans TaxID=694055 RepID=UPI00064E05FD|nr:hypothetical protein [Ornithinibacillus contaminans]